MFSKNDKHTDTLDTVIGKETVLDGKINSKASVRVEGKVLGEISCEGDLVVGHGGIVEANVVGRNITVAGMIHGDVTAFGTVHIEAKGKLRGNVKMKSFVVDEGGVFEGESKMNKETDTPSKEKEKKKKATV